MRNLLIISALLCASFAQAQWISVIGSKTLAGGSSVAPPTFSPVAGTYSSTQTVTISTVTSLAVICYTTDGSTPTESANLCSGGTTQTYTTPISVSTTQTVSALGTKAGLTDSSVASALYTITGLCTPPTTTYRWLPNAGCSTSVACMIDQDSGNNASQTTSGDLPTYSATAAPGSQPALTFNGTSDFLTFGTGLPIPTTGTMQTFAAVYMPLGSARAAALSGATSATVSYLTPNNGYPTDRQALLNTNYVVIASGTATVSSSTWYATAASFTMTSTTAMSGNFYIESGGSYSSDGSFTGATTDVAPAAAAKQIGLYLTTTFADFELAEIDFYNGVWSPTQLTAWASYVSCQYGGH